MINLPCLINGNTREKRGLFVLIVLLLFFVHISGQTCNKIFSSYSFGLQKLDFFHQGSVGIIGPKVRLELQQGFGQRNMASGMLFSQTGAQGAYQIACKYLLINPYLRYAFGGLSGPFKFMYHRVEFGVLYVYESSKSTKFPLDLICSSGLGCGWEIQNKSNQHNYLDYSINVGLQYTFK